MVEFEWETELKLTCALGGYYNMIKSCDILEFEILTEWGNRQPSSNDFPGFINNLMLRRYLHLKGDPITQALGRSAAIAISTVIIFLEDGHFKTFVRERSRKATVHQNLLHVIPSFMFQPVVRQYIRDVMDPKIWTQKRDSLGGTCLRSGCHPGCFELCRCQVSQR